MAEEHEHGYLGSCYLYILYTKQLAIENTEPIEF